MMMKFKLVPTEPTEEMCVVGIGFSPNAVRVDTESEVYYQAGISVARETYKSMISNHPDIEDIKKIIIESCDFYGATDSKKIADRVLKNITTKGTDNAYLRTRR